MDPQLIRDIEDVLYSSGVIPDLSFVILMQRTVVLFNWHPLTVARVIGTDPTTIREWQEGNPPSNTIKNLVLCILRSVLTFKLEELREAGEVPEGSSDPYPEPSTSRFDIIEAL